MDLLLLGRETAYYFLGGTDIEAARSRPNDLVKMAVMEWLVGRGYRRYVLGGGVRPGDGLERHKKRFAPHGGTSFRTAERVLDPAGYAALVQARRTEALATDQDWDDDSDFFPLSRAPLRPRHRARAPAMGGGSSWPVSLLPRPARSGPSPSPRCPSNAPVRISSVRPSAATCACGAWRMYCWPGPASWSDRSLWPWWRWE